MKRRNKRRGQVAVFYALLIPIFLLMGGVGLDLGWYYLNVSRLQNAADASVIAGAKALTFDTANFKNYKYKNLVDKYPGNNPDTTTDTTAGNLAAANYTLKNLSSDATYGHEEGSEVYTMKDNYTRGDNTITMTPGLYKDAQNNYYYVIGLSENIHHFFLGFLDDMKAGVVAVARLDYYKSNGGRDSGKGAEQELPEGTNILREMYALEDVSVMRNWEIQTNASNDWYKNWANGQDKYKGNTTEFQDTKNQYKNGEHYRYERVNIYSGSSNQGSMAGKIYNYNMHYTDSLNLDTKQDVSYKFTKDWDIGYTAPEGLGYLNGTNANNIKYRIHTTFNFEEPYEARRVLDKSKDKKVDIDKATLEPIVNNAETCWYRLVTDENPGEPLTAYKEPEDKVVIDKETNKQVLVVVTGKGEGYPVVTDEETGYPQYVETEDNPEDVLYARIESEPIWELEFKQNHKDYNSVRQMIININQSNLNELDETGKIKKKNRPLMIFYDGPEKINENSSVRDSQPVILNLNADVRVILFAPNSPVIINGNGYKMQGFVIADKFVRLTTETDYRTENGRYFDSNGKEYFKIDPQKVGSSDDKHNPVRFVDENGNVDTRDLDSDCLRDPDYIAKLKDDSERSDYLEQFASDEYYLRSLKNDLAYASCYEIPERADVISDWDYEKIYLREAFNLSASSYYDSFRLTSLKRNIYTYLDNYTNNTRINSVDMFFTTMRSGWVD